MHARHLARRQPGLGDLPTLKPKRAINGATADSTTIISTFITTTVILRIVWKTAQETAHVALPR